MDPPWVVEPDYFKDGFWILGKSDYLKKWRAWFNSLPEDQKTNYQETYPVAGTIGFYDVFGRPPHDPTRESDKFRDRDGLLFPPWKAFPTIPLGSIGWRMGAGEDYWCAFKGWYEALSGPDQAIVRERYPEPAAVEHGYPWTGFYDRLEKY